MIQILFFAQLREQLQCEKISLEIIAPLTLAELRQRLIALHPQWSIFLNNENLLFAVNQTLVKASQQIQNGDEVAFFPPVTGG
ncbi:MAG TPA: molybdopterin converting factor subunit 1 [Cellvibrio sp.]|nr:molybdopterin converting factor subunit 1 [Cellvibrio sp.]